MFIDPKGVEISIFKDRVEIYNPGTFPDKYTPEDYIESKAHSVLRNPLIAELLYKSKDSEAYSSGIQRIYNECKENDVRIDFRKEPYGFTVIFYRKSFSEDIKNNDKNLIDVKNVGKNVGKNVNINKTEREILKLMIQNANITQEEISKILGKTKRTIERNVNSLKNKGIIERIGSKKDGYWNVNL